MRRLRISAISYLNTAPLMWDFRHEHPAFDVSYTVPSRCAAELAQASADVGIIPAAAYANISGLVILPGVAIASKRAVRSILLVSKVPLEQIKTVALDSSSLTSVALVQILFARWWRVRSVRFRSADPDLPTMLKENDAALVIGDPALKVDRSQYTTYDLAEEWIKFTGKPFVFAFWAVREAGLTDFTSLDLPAIFQQSRNHGLVPENFDVIVREWAGRLGLSAGDVRNYLTNNIYYDLDPDCLEGLALFYRYATECGLLPDAPPLRFAEAGKLALI